MGNRGVFLTFIFILFVGVVAGGVWMHRSNRAREQYLDQQYERLDQEWGSVMLMKELGDAEFRDYAAAVHEQSRIARNIQERLHEQELALAGAENGWIYLMIAAMAATGIAAAWINRSIHDRARITIRNALGLPPSQMRGYLMKSQIAATLSIPRLTAGETDSQQAAPKKLEPGRSVERQFHPPVRGKRRNRGTRK